MKVISIVLPILNEELSVSELYLRITKEMEALNYDYEVIAVDDGSTDSTPTLLAEIHRQDPRWKLVLFSRNFGHQNAVSAGLEFSRGDAVIVMDSDLQDPPEELHRFLSKWEEGYQVVYAIRTARKEGLAKRMAYYLFYRIFKKLSVIDVPLDSGDFCIMDRKVVDAVCALGRGLDKLAWFTQGNLATRASPNTHGPSWSVWHLMASLPLAPRR